MSDRAPPESREGMLKITEIFHSLQGESLQAGLPTVFVRLTGCPLRCSYCDSEYAFYGGEWRHFDEIIEEIRKYDTPLVCVTGGEPLAQKRCAEFLVRLCDAGFRVSLETSGALDIGIVDERVTRVMDIKTPASREQSSNRWENLDELTENDQLKFVICSRADYEWARDQLAGRDLPGYCEVLFSPAWGLVDPVELADWVLQDRLPVRVESKDRAGRSPVRFQLQLHKVLWGDVPGR